MDSLRASPWPQRKDLGTLPAFAIGPTAVEEKTKTDCGTRKGNKQRTRALQRPWLLFTKTRIQFRNLLIIRRGKMVMTRKRILLLLILCNDIHHPGVDRPQPRRTHQLPHLAWRDR